MEILAAIVASLSVLMLVAYAVRARAMSPADSRLRVLTPLHEVSMERREDGSAILRRGVSSIPALGRFLNRRGYSEAWQFDLQRAGSNLRPGEYFMVRMTAALIPFAVVFLLTRSPLGVVLAAVAALVGYKLPALWLRRRVGKRINAIEAQLMETITLISNAQRAGFAFAQGVDIAAKRMGPPISVELNRMLLDVNMGASTEEALVAMNERIGSEDLDLVVTAILIQRQTGGNLAEVLDNVTEIMRDRDRIRGDIKTMTASQRMTGWILSLWPATLGLVFFAINPGMMSLMWTTVPGIVLLVIWFTLNVLGVFSLRRILAIDI